MKFIKAGFCKFRTRPYALEFGGFGGCGTAFEWFGVKLAIGRNQVPGEFCREIVPVWQVAVEKVAGETPKPIKRVQVARGAAKTNASKQQLVAAFGPLQDPEEVEQESILDAEFNAEVESARTGMWRRKTEKI